ncbi:MAG: sigma-70 family RNA polymerase sigma factor [Polyangiaceae bacterium]|nr:sigma-70 family RNA polymerase sigma factor [Polyangiaceae bacterium]
MSQPFSLSRAERSHLKVVRAEQAARVSEEQLWQGLLAQDPQSQREVWLRYAPLVERVVRGLTSDSADVADLSQEVFIRLFRKIGQLSDATKLRAYVVGICYRVASEHRRFLRARAWFGLTASGELPEPPLNLASDHAVQAVQLLRSIVAQLSRRDQDLFLLRYVEQMELEEIALAVKSSLSSVRRHVQRARTRLLALARSEPELMSYLALGGVAHGPE